MVPRCLMNNRRLYYLLYCLAHWELSPTISHNMDTNQSRSNLGWGQSASDFHLAIPSDTSRGPVHAQTWEGRNKMSVATPEPPSSP